MTHKLKPAFAWLKTKAAVIKAVVLTGVLSVWATGAAFASIPDANGLIQACRTTSTGAVRIIDTSSQSCDSGTETSIAWHQDATGYVDDLSGADFSNSDVRYTDFSMYDLSGANFIGAVVTGADFSGANLSNAQFEGTSHDVNFEGANTTGTVFTAAFYIESNFSGLDLSNRTFWMGEYKGGDFSGSDLSGTTITGVDFSTDVNSEMITDFSGADLSNAILTNVNFNDTDLTGATLSGVTWSSNITCPDGTNSDNNSNTCAGHLAP